MKRRVLNIIIIVEIVFILAGVLVFGVTNGRYYGMVNITKEYFQSYAKKDVKNLYSMLNIQKSAWLKENSFAKSIESIEGIRYSKFSIGDIQREKQRATVDIVYQEDKDGTEKHFLVNLSKQKKKALSIFPVWKVEPDHFVVKDVEIVTPKDVTLYVDGIEVEKKLESSALEDVYHIDQIFLGEHIIQERVDNVELRPQKVNFRQDKQRVEVKNMLLNSEDERGLLSLLEKDVKTLWTGAYEKTDFGDLSFDSALKRDYWLLQQQFSRGNRKNQIIGMAFSHLKGKLIQLQWTDDVLQAEILVTGNIDYCYTQSSWFSKEVSEKQNEVDFNAQFNYQYVNQHWVLVEINHMPSLDY
ncbi:MAG: hypothetical protein KHZ61_08755 [Lachnospiraceae bacterium]|nr:hypothetical protein [Lachnospiraceae bacterium]